jgi:hypothetical protein
MTSPSRATGRRINPVPDALEGDYHFREDADDTNRAKWTFRDLEPGMYEVLATWNEADTRSDDVTYFVRGSNTAVVTDLDEAPLFNAGLGDDDVTPLMVVTVTIDTGALTITGDDGGRRSTAPRWSGYRWAVSRRST